MKKINSSLKRFGAPEIGSVGYQLGDHKIIVEKKNGKINNKNLYEIRSYSPAHHAWVFEVQASAKNYISAARDFFALV